MLTQNKKKCKEEGITSKNYIDAYKKKYSELLNFMLTLTLIFQLVEINASFLF
jgi:hypothetical protein